MKPLDLAIVFALVLTLATCQSASRDGNETVSSRSATEFHSPALPLVEVECPEFLPAVMPNELWRDREVQGSVRTEAEYKHAIRGSHRGNDPEELAEAIARALNEVLGDDAWAAPRRPEIGGVSYRLQERNPGDFVTGLRFLDYYFDTASGLNYRRNVSLRLRQRFDRGRDLRNWLRGNTDPSPSFPFRAEAQAKFDRRAVGGDNQGLTEVTEARFERVPLEVPASHIAELICDFQSGTSGENPPAIPTAADHSRVITRAAWELWSFYSRNETSPIAFKPNVVVVTERRRLHVLSNFQNRSRQTFIITVDRFGVLAAGEALRSIQRNEELARRGLSTEIEVEFERNVSNQVTYGSDLYEAFRLDQHRLNSIIRDSLAGLGLRLEPEPKSKYAQAYERVSESLGGEK